MCNKEGNIFKKTISLKNYYKNSLNNINNDFDIFLILILSSSMVYLSILPSLLPEKNLIYKLVLKIVLSSPV